jgi:hypothetical protein
LVLPLLLLLLLLLQMHSTVPVPAGLLESLEIGRRQAATE